MSGPRPAHLLRRGAVYWVRFRVPTDLVSSLGCTEIRRSLGVKDLAAARRRCLAATLWFQSTLDTLRRMPSPSHTDLEDAARAFFQRLTEEVGLERLGVLDDPELDRRLRTSDERIVELDRQLATNDFDVWVKRAAASMCENAAVDVSEIDDEGRLLARRLAARAERAKLAGLVHNLTSPGITYAPQDTLFAAVASPLQLAARPRPTGSMSIKAAADLYEAKIRNRNVGTSQITETVRVLRWLMEVHGSQTPLADVTTGDLRAFRDGIVGLGVFRGKNIPFAHRKADKSENRIKSVTAIRYWSSIVGFFKWAVDDGHISHDPLGGLKIDRRKGEERASPEPFSSEELRALFKTPLFAGHKSPKRLKEPGATRTRGPHWWSFLLLIYTGMRAGEASQLLASDFKFEAPNPHIKVRETDDAGRKVKSVKTKASIRDVPIHEDLLALGLREFVERRGKAYPARAVLFPLRPGADGRKSDGLTKFWGDYLRRFALWSHGRATHVGRHTLTAQLRAAMVPEEDIGAIIGHAGRTITAGYGGAFPLGRKASYLAKIDFGFDVVAVLGGPFDAKKHGE